MGLETCFHVTTVVPTTTTRPLGQRAKFNRIPTTHKLNLQPCKGLTRGTTSKSSDLSPVGRSSRGGGVVCCASAAGKVVEATETDWSSVVEGSVGNPILVEFWAPWCGPCRMIAPIMDELAKEYEGKIGCYKVNTDQCPNVATKHGIRSVPTVMLFKNGEKKESIVGAVPKSTLTAIIDKYLEM